ncbi:MAG: NAD(+) diphosphatase [Acidiferrobacterales bacterium]|nr:NAD(+) diphosphatase [Acidiferrobacterales bacterium]
MDDLKRSLLNVFTCSDLNRMVSRRKDDEQLTSLQASASARFVLFHQDQFFMSENPSPAPVLVTSDGISALHCSVENSIYLGCREKHHYFALDIGDTASLDRDWLGNGQFAGLREQGYSLKAEDATLVSYAKAMFHWHRAHGFCGECGSATVSVQGGHCRQCVQSQCAKMHFPRTDPAIIVAVTNNSECLFGRQKAWPQFRYSVIAGFVEPGESVEQAVVREVLEETDITLDTVDYHSSQPWPFPGSIMLGFTATASSYEIRLNDGELQDAIWRSVDDVVDGLASGEFRVPPRLSIAYRLVEDWFDEHSPRTLSDVLNDLRIVRSW